MTPFLAICAITWAITAEIRISKYRNKRFRELEENKTCREQIAQLEKVNTQSVDDAHALLTKSTSLREEIEALKKLNGKLSVDLDSAKQEEEALKSKLNETNKRCRKLEAELEELRWSYSKSTEPEKEIRKDLEAEIRTRRQGLAAYIQPEPSARSSTRGEGSTRDQSNALDISNNDSTKDEHKKPNLAIFPDRLASYAIVDIETTGFSDEDEIIEIAVINVDHKGSVSGRLETTIRSTKDSGEYALKAHRLGMEMLRHSPRFEEVSHAIANCLDGRVIVAHNLSFDLRFLDNAFKKVEGLVINFGHGIDTLYGGVNGEKIKLDEICKAHNISHQSHCAMGDAEALLSLLACGVIKPKFSGNESAAKVVGLMRLGDCELRPRSTLPTNASIIEDTATVSGSDPQLNSFPVTNFIKGPLITLQAGDKVCCSCSSKNSVYRDKLYAKHNALGLASARSISARHKCIILEDFSSTAGKALQARLLRKPFVRADDFIGYEEGGALQTWIPSSDS